MAIKFVDVEPEDAGKPKRSGKADASAVKRGPYQKREKADA